MKKNIVLQIPNMNCGSCEKKIRQGLMILEDANIDFSLNFSIPSKELGISYDSSKAQALLFKKEIESLGFQVAKMEIKE